jgi:CHRD domain
MKTFLTQLGAWKTRVILLVVGAGATLWLFGVPKNHDHAHAQAAPRAELTRSTWLPLRQDAGESIGAVYEAFLSPQQEGGEESETPIAIPPVFRSTAPSVPRNQRTSRGHALIEFANDLSRVDVFLAIEKVKLEDINMLHLHCGRPGQLGPILVDFAEIGDFKTYFADGVLRLEVRNEDIVTVTQSSQGIIDAFTKGCPIVPSLPMDKVKTIAGMELIARQGELYFNLHTKGQTYFGDIRGQFMAVK